jgi:hypothetical protein
MSIMVEIRSAEGGEHAKLLVIEQAGIYTRLCIKRGEFSRSRFRVVSFSYSTPYVLDITSPPREYLYFQSTSHSGKS